MKSLRRIKLISLYRVEHQYKFKTINEALKEANTIVQCLSRFVKRNKISCKAMVCVSEHDVGKASPSLKKDGRRGRPAKIFKDKHREGKEAPKTKPHLHVLIKSKQANKVASKVVQNTNKRYRKRNPDNVKSVISRRYPVTNDRKYIGYVMHQGTSFRFVENDGEGEFRDFDFEDEYEKYKPNIY